MKDCAFAIMGRCAMIRDLCPIHLSLFCKAAAGSARDALSLTDQAIAYGAGSVRAADVINMLGTSADDVQVPLLLKVAQGAGAGVLAEIDRLAERHFSYDVLLQDLDRTTYAPVGPGRFPPGTGAARADRSSYFLERQLERHCQWAGQKSGIAALIVSAVCYNQKGKL